MYTRIADKRTSKTHVQIDEQTMLVNLPRVLEELGVNLKMVIKELELRGFKCKETTKYEMHTHGISKSDKLSDWLHITHPTLKDFDFYVEYMDVVRIWT
jgi:hypothetical protein